jgi:hypothetical protein
MQSSVKNARSLIARVPELIKASLITQAFEIQKVIASTFEFTDEFKEHMRSIPPHYIERAQEAYSDAMFKSFDSGYKNGAIKEKLITDRPSDSSVEDAVRLKVPMPFGLSQDLLASFETDIGGYFETAFDMSGMLQQLAKDMEKAFAEGVMEYLKTLPEDVLHKPKEAPAPKIEVPKVEAPATEVVAAAAQPLSREDVLKKIEEYTKLLKDPEAEEVLRYTMGLPVKTRKVEARVIGPYNTQSLKQKVLELLKTHKLSEDEMQVLIVDCVVSNVGTLKDEDLASLLNEKLTLGLESPQIEAAEIAADKLADQMAQSMSLPGDLMFMKYQDDYCLVFTFERSGVAELAKEGDALVFASKKKEDLPDGPQGTLTVKEQDEIKALSSLAKSKMTYKDVKKASSKVAALLSEAMTQIRNSKVDIAEGAKALKASLEDLIVQAYGKDGLAYYQYVKK